MMSTINDYYLGNQTSKTKKLS